jgi:catechol 2,3-dioxygenase-like lactoylglutathione lyase family enzyme
MGDTTMTSLRFILAGVLGLGIAVGNRAVGEESSSEFSRTTIDLGVVVSDIGKSVKFYTEAIGFTENQGFKVPADFCNDAGLTDKQPLDIHVLTLGEDESATKLKLMQIPGVKSQPSKNAFIHSQLGVSYLTIFVTDTNAAMVRLKKAGVSPIAKGPVPLPKGFPEGVFLTVVRDPDGNLIELVGPKTNAP